MYDFDATPLIYLGAVQRLPLIDSLSRECVVPETVYEEVVTTGIEEGHADARRVEHVVDDHVLEVVSVEDSQTFDRLRRNQSLSEADVAVLTVAAVHDATAVMDEQYGRDVAAAEGISTRGTAYLVLRLLKEANIDAEEARDIIDAMLDAGWYCAPDLYSTLLWKIEHLE